MTGWSLIKPWYPLSLFPFSLSFRFLSMTMPNTYTMESIIIELTNIFILIRQYHYTMSLHFALLKVSFIFSTIIPNKDSFTLHFILEEFTFINTTIVSKEILSFAMELTFNKVTFIYIILCFKFCFSCLFSFQKVSVIDDCTWFPHFFSFTVLLIIFPLANINRSSFLDKSAIALSLSLYPFPLINITIWISHPTFSLWFLIFSNSFIKRSIREFNLAYTFPFRSIFIPFSTIVENFSFLDSSPFCKLFFLFDSLSFSLQNLLFTNRISS